MAKKKKVAGKKKKNRSKYHRKNKREEKISFRMTGYLKKVRVHTSCLIPFLLAHTQYLTSDSLVFTWLDLIRARSHI